MERTLWIGETAVGPREIAMRFGVDDLAFSTTYRYEGVDLDALASTHGAEFMRSVVFHAVAFEANKAASLKPDTVDFGPYRDLVTPEFWALWSTVWHHVAAQWRYENDLPGYTGPRLAHETAGATPGPVSREGAGRILAFVGGGKDSLVAMALLDEAGLDYDTYGYSHSIYGEAALQHALIDGLVRHGRRARVHRRHWIDDDFLDSPVLEQHPELGIGSLVAAETPSSLFGVLPLVLTEGYTTLALAHERSADHGNLTWDATGEEVNHQWGKGLDAERLLQAYVRDHLVADLTYTSVLKPVYDPVIFSALRQRLDAVSATHSCNVRKPWCEECPKCAYVWLNYRGYLGADGVDGIFRTNLADSEVNQLAFQQMLGLADHTPFECVGQVSEARLALDLARRGGLRGRAIDAFAARATPPGDAEVRELFGVAETHHTMPDALAARVIPILQTWAASGLAELGYSVSPLSFR